MDDQPETAERDPHQDIIDDLKIKHPGLDLYSFESPGAGEFFVHRRCTAPERRIFRKLQGDDKKLEAQDSLMGCIVYPDKETFRKKCEEIPFVVEQLVDAVLAASGVFLDAVRKKL